MDESKLYLGVPQPVVLAVGKMVPAAAQVEHFATDIAYQVGVPDAEDLAMDWPGKAIKANLNANGVPEGLAVTATGIKTWLAEAARRVRAQERDRPRCIHAASVQWDAGAHPASPASQRESAALGLGNRCAYG